MKISSIDAGTFKCDGGAIFGSVPKILWSKQVQTDENNLIKTALRCLLIETKGHKILIETGIGTKHNEKFLANNGVENSDNLLNSLEAINIKPEDITDVLLTHLHWDHSGGCTYYNQAQQLQLTFPNAVHHCSQQQWDNAHHPNIRENDAYFSDDFDLLKEKKQLHIINQNEWLYNVIELRIFNGHTPGQIIPIIHFNNNKIVYASDFSPLAANVRLKWVAAYDLYPVTSMQDKAEFLKEIYDKKMLLFFEHDLENECCTIKWDDKKGPMVNQTGKLKQFIPNELS